MSENYADLSYSDVDLSDNYVNLLDLDFDLYDDKLMAVSDKSCLKQLWECFITVEGDSSRLTR